MDIRAIAPGLAGTGAAISRQLAQSDERAVRTVADTLAAADPDPAVAGEAAGRLPGDLVGLQSNRIVNAILFNVFRAQAEQQREAADLIRPR